MNGKKPETAESDAFAIFRLYVFESGRQSCAGNAVAEDHGGVAVVVELGGVDSFFWSMSEEVRHFGPENVVHTHFES